LLRERAKHYRRAISGCRFPQSPQGDKAGLFSDLGGRDEKRPEKLAVEQNATTGAEARADWAALRGAEAPLFHGTARISEFFRSF